MLSSLQNRVKDAEEFAVEKENKMSHVDITISSLKKELQSQVDEKQKLEVSLKHHMQVEDENHKKAEKWESKVQSSETYTLLFCLFHNKCLYSVIISYKLREIFEGLLIASFCFCLCFLVSRAYIKFIMSVFLW